MSVLYIKEQGSVIQKMDERIIVTKNQNRLLDIFDSQGVDCMEIEMGMLVRRKKEDGYEWLIEI